MPAPPTSPPITNRASYNAARLLCRRRAPDFFFASHLLPRPQRQAVYCLAAVATQLWDIIHHREPAGSACEAEPIARKRAVCSAVLEHLYAGTPTGKPELDGFAGVAGRLGVARDHYETFCDGLAAEETVLRLATWARLSDNLERVGGSIALVAARALDADRDAMEHPTTARQVLSWGAALRMTPMLLTLGDDLRRGLLRVALDDLVKFDLTESRVKQFAEAGTSGGDERWAALMSHQTTRVRNLLRGGSRWLSAVSAGRSRRALEMVGALHLALLDRIDQANGDVFGQRIALNFWSRLRQMPGTLR